MQSFPGAFNINVICYRSIRNQEYLKGKGSSQWITNPHFRRWKFSCTHSWRQYSHSGQCST